MDKELLIANIARVREIGTKSQSSVERFNSDFEVGVNLKKVAAGYALDYFLYGESDSDLLNKSLMNYFSFAAAFIYIRIDENYLELRDLLSPYKGKRAKKKISANIEDFQDIDELAYLTASQNLTKLSEFRNVIEELNFEDSREIDNGVTALLSFEEVAKEIEKSSAHIARYTEKDKKENRSGFKDNGKRVINVINPFVGSLVKRIVSQIITYLIVGYLLFSWGIYDKFDNFRNPDVNSHSEKK